MTRFAIIYGNCNLFEKRGILMILQNLPTIFEPARPVLQRIEQAGFEAYFVGGCVRDTILGDSIHDIDIATSAYPSEIKAIFNHTVDTGIEHGTVMILDHGTGYETTTFRTESGYQDYRRPDHVTFVRSLAEDLKRRDFTINALALKENGEVIDLFDGLTDLRKHLIRAVGNPDERFHEDALRMMRAVRFASKLDFQIDRPTIQGITDNAHLLAKIAVERIRVEFEKMLMGQNPVSGISQFLSTQLYQYCPGLTHQQQTLSRLLILNHWNLTSDVQVWSLIATILGLNGQAIDQFLKQWKTSNDLIRQVRKVVPAINALHHQQLDPLILFRTGWQGICDANQVAQTFGWSIDQSQLTALYHQLPIKSVKELAIDGAQLIKQTDIKPGPLLGKILHQLTIKVVNGEVVNDQEQLLALAKEWGKEE